MSEAVECADESLTIFVAVDDGGLIVGVICIGYEDGSVATSHVLAVIHGRRREGIGTLLKRTAMAEAATAGRTQVVSQVHRKNYAMLGLNAKLGVEDAPDPEEAELRFSAVAVELTD